MKNSSARQGAVRLSPEEHQLIAMMKRQAECSPVVEEDLPPKESQACFSGIYLSFARVIDPEGECLQDRLGLWREGGQPGLDEVQALAALFFADQSFQIFPDPKDGRRVNVLGLFKPLLP